MDQVKISLTRNGYPNQRSLAHDTGLALATVSKFLTGKPVGHTNFEELCHKLNLDWREISTPNAKINVLNNRYKLVKKIQFLVQQLMFHHFTLAPKN
ncbi:hypothetical protein [Nostoc linckia]|nr:hypothetical protein [Nostoc linckia]